MGRGAWNQTRSERLAALVQERGLLRSGFYSSLKDLVREFHPDKKEAESLYEEITGVPMKGSRSETVRWRPKPAAHRVIRDSLPDRFEDAVVEIYKVEGTTEISDDELCYYGNMADVLGGYGPTFELHILDRHDNEFLIHHCDLESFMGIRINPKDKHWTSLKKSLRSLAEAQHHDPVIIDRKKEISEYRKEISKLRRQLKELVTEADYSQISGRVQDIIYGLGRGESHYDIARRVRVEVKTVKMLHLLLKANEVNPRELVKKSHAKWKAAYDAVRELGVKF